MLSYPEFNESLHADLAILTPQIRAGLLPESALVRWAVQRKMMAPVSTWHPEAQRFAAIYKEDRILFEEYVTRFGGSQKLIKALIAWDIGFADPLYQESHNELRGERLKAIADSTSDCENVIVPEAPFTQIAFLPNELIQRSQSDPKLAKALLGLAVSHAARVDPGWQHLTQVSGRRNKEEVTVSLVPALWIADLCTKAWVPVKSDQGTQNVLATAGNLKEMLDHTWLLPAPARRRGAAVPVSAHVGPATVRSLALIAELIYGTRISRRDL